MRRRALVWHFVEDSAGHYIARYSPGGHFVKVVSCVRDDVPSVDVRWVAI